jgi:hypothetical protein
MTAGTYYIASARIAQKTPLPIVTTLLPVTQPLPSNCCLPGFTIAALSKYATILTKLNIVQSVLPLDIDLKLKIIKL